MERGEQRPRIVITGAACGIAAATMAVLRGRGAEVVGLDLEADRDDLISCDVRDQESVDGAVAAATERLGGGVDDAVLAHRVGGGEGEGHEGHPRGDVDDTAAGAPQGRKGCAGDAPGTDRDIVTTRTGKLTVALSRFAPGRFVDWVILRQTRKGMRGQRRDESAAGPLSDFAKRVSGKARA